jgi:hypothetical protein
VAGVLIRGYLRLAKRAAIMVGRYTQAHIRRKIEGDPALEDRFGALARFSILRCGSVIKSSASAAPKLTLIF